MRAGKAFLSIADIAARGSAEKQYKRMCALGSGALTGVAREAALKTLEMTAGDVKAMAESVLGGRHGPMATLDRDTLLICLVSGDTRRQRYELDLLREVKAKTS